MNRQSTELRPKAASRIGRQTSFFMPRAFIISLLFAYLFFLARIDAQTSPDTAPTGEDVCLSLRVLSKRADEALSKGQPLGKEVANMGGIGWVMGYVIDAQNSDIILVGRRCPGRPNLHLDDLVATFRNLAEADVSPYCSLDPLPANVLETNRVIAAISLRIPEDAKMVIEQLEKAIGPQQTEIGGVHRDARMAHVMIDADYHMKKVSQGLVNVPDVSSIVDRMIAAGEAAIDAGLEVPALGASRSRFWFHIKKGAVVSFTTADGIVWLESCPVGLLTETQRNTADGSLYDSGEIDPWAEAFAAEMSEHFAEVAKSVPVYADLENLFRLRALCCAMYHRDDVHKAALDVSYFLSRHQWALDAVMLPSLPGLANCREWSKRVDRGNMEYEYFLAPVVCGGVSMETPVEDHQFHPDDTGLPERVKVAALMARPSLDKLTWLLSGEFQGEANGKKKHLRTEESSDAQPEIDVGTESMNSSTGTHASSPSAAPDYVRRAIHRQGLKF